MPDTTTTCPICSAPVIQHSSDEGTQSVQYDRTEIEELNELFDQRHWADMRAIQRWQQDHPDRANIFPDHADLVVWLLEKLELAEQERNGACLAYDLATKTDLHRQAMETWKERAELAEADVAALKADLAEERCQYDHIANFIQADLIVSDSEAGEASLLIDAVSNALTALHQARKALKASNRDATSANDGICIYCERNWRSHSPNCIVGQALATLNAAGIGEVPHA